MKQIAIVILISSLLLSCDNKSDIKDYKLPIETIRALDSLKKNRNERHPIPRYFMVSYEYSYNASNKSSRGYNTFCNRSGTFITAGQLRSEILDGFDKKQLKRKPFLIINNIYEFKDSVDYNLFNSDSLNP